MNNVFFFRFNFITMNTGVQKYNIRLVELDNQGAILSSRICTDVDTVRNDLIIVPTETDNFTSSYRNLRLTDISGNDRLLYVEDSILNTRIIAVVAGKVVFNDTVSRMTGFARFFGSNSIIITDTHRFKICKLFQPETHTYTIGHSCVCLPMSIRPREFIIPDVDNNNFHLMNGRFFFVDSSYDNGSMLRMYDNEKGLVDVVNLFKFAQTLPDTFSNVSSLNISVSTDMEHIMLYFEITGKEFWVMRLISRLLPADEDDKCMFKMQNIDELTEGKLLAGHKSLIRFPAEDIEFSDEYMDTFSGNRYTFSVPPDMWSSAAPSTITLCENSTHLNDSVGNQLSIIELPPKAFLVKNPMYDKLYWITLYDLYKSDNVVLNKKSYSMIKGIFDLLPREIIDIIFSFVTNNFNIVTDTYVSEFRKHHKF